MTPAGRAFQVRMTPLDAERKFTELGLSDTPRQGRHCLGASMTKHCISILLVGLLLACSPKPDYVNSVLEFQAHKNAGDLESALGQFAEQATLDFGPLGSMQGLPAIRGILEYDLALNAHLEFTDCSSADREVRCRVVESNDWLRTAGIESITYDENRFMFEEDGRIASISATLSAESGQAMGAAIAEFHQWATTNRPTDYAVLFSDDGKFIYSRDNAEKVLVLLRAWQD